MTEKTIDHLRYKIYEDRVAMGSDAAKDVARKISDLLKEKDFVNVVFAAAPSQNEFLEALSKIPGITWQRVNAFHMDEYVGLRNDSPKRFGYFLKEKLFNLLPLHSINYIDGSPYTVEKECKRYSILLNELPPDITCLGIGINTHLAFNDPHVANFNDPLSVKKVDLDPVSRQQQVDDGCFTTIEEVPEEAITLTIPALMRAKAIYCVVPASAKSRAVYETFYANITPLHPSTILRLHPDARLYLDRDSAAEIVDNRLD